MRKQYYVKPLETSHKFYNLFLSVTWNMLPNDLLDDYIYLRYSLDIKTFITTFMKSVWNDFSWVVLHKLFLTPLNRLEKYWDYFNHGRLFQPFLWFHSVQGLREWGIRKMKQMKLLSKQSNIFKNLLLFYFHCVLSFVCSLFYIWASGLKSKLKWSI